jgi:hypothetical protein
MENDITEKMISYSRELSNIEELIQEFFLAFVVKTAVIPFFFKLEGKLFDFLRIHTFVNSIFNKKRRMGPLIVV